jgi:large subunit ribosomal protein L2
MALIKMKPTSPGARFVIKIDRSHLHKGGPLESADVERQAPAGATFRPHHHAPQGRRFPAEVPPHRFPRDKDGIAGTVERVEYDPNRTAHIALVKYADGERRYIIAPKGVEPGDEVRSGADSPIKAGNAMQLRHIPVGSTVHNVETEARQGRPARAQRRRLRAVHGARRHLRVHPPEVRRDPQGAHRLPRHDGRGRNDEHNLRQYGKAGAKRWRGIRPTVRGVVMNPVDHPHGGGEGKSGQGNPHPVSPWGWNQGQEDPQEQAHEQHDRAAPSEQDSLTQKIQELKQCLVR